jgi:hypothetical protein
MTTDSVDAHPHDHAGPIGVAAMTVRPDGMRNDLTSMLLPFFPEDPGLRAYSATIDGYSVAIYSDHPDYPIATAGDRRVLNYLAGILATSIRSGAPPTRSLNIELRGLLETMASDAVVANGIGGSEYQRVISRLNRLMATVIETEMPIADDIRRRRRFSWIDSYEHDDQIAPGGRKILRLTVRLSEEAFHWLSRSLGFDVSHREFQHLTAGRSSLWRIFEICLARLIQNAGEDVHISLSELRDRVPIASELKVFKNRTLRNAMEGIAASKEMSRRLRLALVRETEAGFIPVEPRKRAPLDSLYVRVSRGAAPLPTAAPLIKGDVTVPAPGLDPLIGRIDPDDPSGRPAMD